MKIDFSSRLGLKKLWVGIGWLLVIAVIVLSLIPSPPLMMQTIDYGDKIGHLIAYFVLMGWFALVYHMPRQRLEILQGLSGIRHADWMDIVANRLGS